VTLNQQQLVKELIPLSTGKRICLAYSGGIDSHVLLHLLATANHPELSSIYAIHVDHGLHADSVQWAEHCADTAASLNIPFSCLKVEVKDIDLLGMEAAARAARYQALQQHLSPQDLLLTAQHQQDQAETLLLQLLRGAGPKGLSAMARNSQLGFTPLFRPLLNTPQADIIAYAYEHKLQWIDDPSNVETRWNRNYIRHNVWPEIIKRWPSAAKTISRSADHCAETSELMTELAKQDLAEMGVGDSSTTLPVLPLLKLSPARYKNALRHFIEWKHLPLPSTTCMQKVIDEVCLAKQDSMPVVSWSGVEVRRYQNQLYFMRPLIKHDVTQEINCDGLNDVILNDGRILSWQAVQGQGISKQMLTAGLTLRYRQGGEQIKPQGKLHHKSLKHLFQQWAVLPWQRDRIPLLYSGEQLVAVVGYCISDEYAVSHEQHSYFPVLNDQD